MNYRRFLVPGIVTLAILGFGALLAAGLVMKEPLTGASGSARVNRPAATIALTTITLFDTSVGRSHSAPIPFYRFFNSC